MSGKKYGPSRRRCNLPWSISSWRLELVVGREELWRVLVERGERLVERGERKA